MRVQAAFTYLETLVAVLLIIILYGLAYPNFRGLLGNNENSIIQKKIMHALEMAQLTAVSHHTAVAFCLADKNKQCAFTNIKYVMIFADQGHHIFSLTKLSHAQGIFYWQIYPKQQHYFTFTEEVIANTNGTLWYCSAGQFPIFALAINKLGHVKNLFPNSEQQIYDSHHHLLSC